jgi:hypothetical protein
MLYFSDQSNFHARNFPALFRTIAYFRLPTRFASWEDRGLKRAFGNYAPFTSYLESFHREIQAMSTERLFALHRQGVRVFDVCKYELLQHLMSLPAWYDRPTENDDQVIFDKMAHENLDALRLNMAAACLWLSYWREQVPRHDLGPFPACIFGNSLAYTRALSLQADALGIVPVVFEHFFTGHDHFMEVRREPIQGFTQLRVDGRVPPAGDSTLVLRRLADMQNKNVSQRPFRRARRFASSAPTILLLGQVLNDFAAVSPNNRVLGTIAIYKQLVTRLLVDTDVNLIIKTHPYEARKTESGRAITNEELAAHLATRHPAAAHRVWLVDDYPLAGLFTSADLCVTLHSQGALEAIAAGLPVATLGDPFYARHGFTTDFDSVPSLVSALAAGDLPLQLSHEQMARYLRFMTRSFSLLVNRNETPHQMLDRMTRMGMSFPVTVAPLRAANKRSGSMDMARKLLTTPRQFFVDALNQKLRPGRQAAAQPVIVPGQPVAQPAAVPGEMILRKTRKLLRNPKLFLTDAFDKRRPKKK